MSKNPPLRSVLREMRARATRVSGPMTDEEKLKILDLNRRGMGPNLIADALGRDPQTVSGFLKRYRSTTQLARARIEASAEQIANRIINNANVEESLEILDRLNVLTKNKAPAAQSQFSIIVGVPGSRTAVPAPGSTPVPMPDPPDTPPELALPEPKDA